MFKCYCGCVAFLYTVKSLVNISKLPGSALVPVVDEYKVDGVLSELPGSFTCVGCGKVYRS